MIPPLVHTFHLDEGAVFRWRFAGLVLGGLLLVAYWQEWIVSPFPWDLGLILTFLYGYSTFHRAFQDVISRRISADQAVTLAALAALYVGEYLAAAEVVYIMLVGETLEAYASQRFHTDLTQLLSLLPQEAHRWGDDGEERVALGELRPEDRVVVYPGERVPVDGVILEGESLLDESSITGESVPRERSVREQVYAGSVNQTARLLVRARQVGETTVLNRIVELVRQARESKAPIQRTADRYAQWFLPLVLGIAVLCYVVTGDWMRSVAILIVACPCAMVLATPAAVLATISALARKGIVVRGGVQIEELSKIDCFAFDKTGTLTRGRPELVRVIPFGEFRPDAILGWAASLEFFSEHLLAKAIREAAESRGLDVSPGESVQRHAGLGLEGTVASSGGKAGPTVLVGSARFLEQRGVTLSKPEQDALDQAASEGGIAVLVGREGQAAGVLLLQDQPRQEAGQAVAELRQLGIRKSLLLTGDNEKAAHRVAREVGIAQVHAGLLPEEKLAHLEDLKLQGLRVAMVGDGVNDSPSLAAAHVGIAMGDTGTDIAAEASGVVLVGDSGLDRLKPLIRMSRHAVKTINDNIFWFGLVFNLAAVMAAFWGYLTAVGAAVVHQGSSFLVLMNSLKLLDRRPSELLPHGLRHRLHHLHHRYHHLRHDFHHLQHDVLHWLHHRNPAHLFRHLLHWAGHRKKSLLRWAAAAAVLAYLFSGVRMLAPEEVGVVQRLGRLVEGSLDPGLHYLAPWPVETLHRLRPAQIRTVELGFRISDSAPGATGGPAAYEWNIQHRQGRYLRREDEALMLTGDEYLVEVNAVVHYSIADFHQYLFASSDLESTLQFLCESALRQVAATMELDRILALDRRTIESAAMAIVRAEADRLGLGVRVQAFHLQDVHPALEVVGAFRNVASALEQKSRMINEAHAYANQRVPIAAGESQGRQIQAQAYAFSRVRRSEGESRRFELRYDAYRQSPQTTRIRVYLEAIEAGLAGKKKYILDQGSGRRKMLLFRNSVFNFGDFEKAVAARGQ